jgi:hypothetical protein
VRVRVRVRVRVCVCVTECPASILTFKAFYFANQSIKNTLKRTEEAFLYSFVYTNSRSQWPRDLRRRSTVARLLRSWVRMPPGAWTFVCFVCCVLSSRGLRDELTTCPEESYRLWRVVVFDLETS